MKIGFISLGCAKNTVDSELMLHILKKSGHKIVNAMEKSDAVIINTCGFITDAKQESIDNIIEAGRLKDAGIIKYIIATGCLSQRYGQELLEELPELDAVVGITHFQEIAQILGQLESGERILKVSEAPKEYIEKGPRVLTTPAGMAYLKIAEGCNNRCSYCAIPLIRGIHRSKKLEDIEQESRILAEQGIKEIVLIAQDTAAYGQDIYGNKALPELLRRIESIDGLEWIRVMYLHPVHINNEIIDAFARCQRVIPYLDIPIQHASTKILQSMNRKHDFDHLQKVINMVRDRLESPVLRTTVMVGFPGEDEEDFNILHDYVAETRFDWLGAFAFTPEEGTVAYSMAQQVAEEVKQYRLDQIMRLQQEISRDKNISRIGKKDRILISSHLDTGLYIGRGYYQAPEVDGVTIVKSPHKLEKGEFAEVKLKAVRGYDLVGEIEPQDH